MSWLSNIFKSKEKVQVKAKPKPKKEVIKYSELSKIASDNAKLIQGNIDQAKVMLNGLGQRKGKKYIDRIARLKKRLEEETFYADYYANPSKYHSERI